MITAKFSGVRNFRIFTVDPGSIVFAQTTVNFLNILTLKIFVVITLKFELCGSTIVMSPNDADGMANSVDPDQTAPLGAV